jgi:hypothetical protein
MPGLPIALVGGIEDGIFRGGGSGSITPGSETVRWLAALIGPMSRVPLLRDRLDLELGATLGLLPYSYGLHYRSGRPLLESRHFDLRTELGLASHF